MVRNLPSPAHQLRRVDSVRDRVEEEGERVDKLLADIEQEWESEERTIGEG